MALDIGQTIKHLRKKAGLSQEKFAEIFGISSQAVSKWELGQTYPDITLLRPIAEFFGVTVDMLLGGDDSGDNEELTRIRGTGYSAATLEQRFGIFRDGLRQMPRNTNLLADAISTGYLLVKIYLGANDSRAEAYFEDTVSLCSRQLTTSHDVNELNYARFILAILYAMFGRTDDAEKIANQFPEISSIITSGAVKTAVRHTAGSTSEEIKARIAQLEQMAQSFVNEISAVRGAYERLLSPKEEQETQMKDEIQWKSEIIKLNGVRISAAAIDGDNIYYFVPETRSLRLYDLKTGTNREVYAFDTDILINSISITPNGTLWAYAYETTSPAIISELDKQTLIRISGLTDSLEVNVVAIPEHTGKIREAVKTDKNGNVYLFFSDCTVAQMLFGDAEKTDIHSEIIVLSPDGSLLHRIKEEFGQPLILSSVSAVRLSDGRVAYSKTIKREPPLTPPFKSYLVPLNPVTGRCDEMIEISEPVNVMFEGYGKYLFYYVNPYLIYPHGLSGFNTEKGAAEIIIRSTDIGIQTSGIMAMSVMKNGGYLIVRAPLAIQLDKNPDDINYDIELLTPHSEIDTRIKLTLAAVHTNERLNKALIEFNRDNKDYRIELKIYNTGHSENITEAFKNDLLAGYRPDILCLSMQPIQFLAHRIPLADLYRFLDNDGILNRDSFIPGLLKHFEIDGKLQFLAPDIILMPLFGISQTADGGQNLTYDELLDELEASPNKVALYNTSNMAAFEIFFSLCADDFINWRTGETHFTDGTYEKLLKICKQQPASPPDYAPHLGYYDKHLEDALKDSDFLYVMDRVFFIQTLTLYREMLGEDYAVKSRPSRESCGVPSAANTYYAISEKCEHKDAAWRLIRSIIYNDDVFNAHQLSVCKKPFEAMLESCMSVRYAETQSEGTSVLNDEMYGPLKHDSEGRLIQPQMTIIRHYKNSHKLYPVYSVPRKDADLAKTLMENAGCVCLYDNVLIEKLKNITQLYFDGEKTAKETAAETGAIVRSHYGFDD